MRVSRSVVLTALALGCGGGGDGTGPTPAAPQAATVQATPQLTFDPSQVTIRTGGTVTWAFGPVKHNVTFQGAAAAIALRPYHHDEDDGGDGGGGTGGGAPANIPDTTNTSVARTFGSAGSYPYVCTIHGEQMSGTVTVQ